MLFRCFSSMMWHRLKGSTGSSRMRGEECNRRGIARGGERIWAIYRLVGKGRETVLVNYVWECTHGGEREGGLRNSLFTVECKQRSMERLAIVVHRLAIGFIRDLYYGWPSVNRACRSRVVDRWKIHHANLGWWLYWLFMSIGLAPLSELTVERGTRERLPFDSLIFFRNFLSDSCPKN